MSNQYQGCFLQVGETKVLFVTVLFLLHKEGWMGSDSKVLSGSTSKAPPSAGISELNTVQLQCVGTPTFE